MKYALTSLSLLTLVGVMILGTPLLMYGAIVFCAESQWPSWAFVILLLASVVLVMLLAFKTSTSALVVILEKEALIVKDVRIPYTSIQGIHTSWEMPSLLFDELVIRHSNGIRTSLAGHRIGPNRGELRRFAHDLSVKLTTASLSVRQDSFATAYKRAGKLLSFAYLFLFLLSLALVLAYVIALLTGLMRFKVYSAVILTVLSLMCYNAWQQRNQLLD
jgi:hypothetical protein